MDLSYGDFLRTISAPYTHLLDTADKVLQIDRATMDRLLDEMVERCESLRHGVNMMPEKVYFHRLDIDYSYPPQYDVVNECKQYIRSSGIVVFNYLDNFEIVKRYLGWYTRALSRAQYPLTGDTMWHLNPFLIDMMHAEILNVYNMRGETPSERRLMAELLHVPVVGSVVVENSNGRRTGEPLALCKFIRRNGV